MHFEQIASVVKEKNNPVPKINYPHLLDSLNGIAEHRQPGPCTLCPALSGLFLRSPYNGNTI